MLILESIGSVPLSWLILERGRFGTVELVDFGQDGLGSGTVELAGVELGKHI